MFISSLHVYPVKGLQGFSPRQWEVVPTGLRFDRHWMLVSESTGAFVSQRNFPAMGGIRATLSANLSRLLIDAGDWTWSCAVDADGEKRKTSIWGDVVCAIDMGDEIARRLSKALGSQLRLVRFPSEQPRRLDPFWVGDETTTTHFADFGPVLVTTQASLDDLNARRVERGLAVIDMDRFRPNLVVAGLAPGQAWQEDQWSMLSTDGVRFELVKPCARCKVVEVDQTTGKPSGDLVLDTLSGFRTLTTRAGKRGIMFGQNAVPRSQQGRVSSLVRVGAKLDLTGSKTPKLRDRK